MTLAACDAKILATCLPYNSAITLANPGIVIQAGLPSITNLQAMMIDRVRNSTIRC